MKYLITGGAGFIGSHLAELLINNGHEVAVLDNLSTGSLDNLRGLQQNPRFRFVKGAAENAVELPELMQGTDTVFHLAAAVGVELVVHNPVHTIETNVHGTENVFHHASAANAKVIITSTSEVYGKATAPRFRETDDLLIGPPTHYRWSYAASKALDEFLALAYFKEKKLRPVVVRLFNTVGPRQTGRYGMVLPRFVALALKNEPLRVYGDGEQIRCFCHVADTVRALAGLDKAGDAAIGEIFNIGTQQAVSINTLAETVIQVVGSRSEMIHIPYGEAYGPGFEDMRRREPDIAKIKRLTGWEPARNLQEIIQEVADFIHTENT